MVPNRSGRPRCDTRQLNLNFFVNISSDQGSEPTSLVPMDNGGKVGNAPLVLSTVVLDGRTSLGLQQSQVITRKLIFVVHVTY